MASITVPSQEEEEEEEEGCRWIHLLPLGWAAGAVAEAVVEVVVAAAVVVVAAVQVVGG